VGRYAFKLPDVGEGIAEAEIVAWHVAPGDQIAEDAPLVDVMTDKATVEITSPVSGKVLELQGEVGQPVAIGSVVAVLDVEGAGQAAEPAGARPAAREAAPAPRAPAPPPPEPEPPPVAPPPAPSAAPAAPALRAPQKPGARPLASPAVRRRALELGVPLQFVPGSGPAGRITREDLEAYAARPAPAGGGAGLSRREGTEAVKVIGLRRRIAERMSEAKRRIPHFSYIEEVDVTELERLRAQLNAEHRDRPRLTVLPFLVRALVRALPAFPQINATYDDEAGVVTRHAAVHLGIAAQTPAGLMVPVLRHAEALDLWAAAAEIARLAEAARSGSAARDELSGSTITLTSLGPLGGLATTPVINRPEVAIVGPNRIIERPVVVEGQVVVRKMMNLSSSFDHRVVDGADAAEFVQRLRRLLETPALLFVDQP
jgi:2-oxoisovalerate dehydrogenase E2 component (dihydrolipoyl transacylase)